MSWKTQGLDKVVAQSISHAAASEKFKGGEKLSRRGWQSKKQGVWDPRVGEPGVSGGLKCGGGRALWAMIRLKEEIVSEIR